MTIDELIERLEEYRDEHGGEIEIRLMTQSNWPFENSVCGIVSAGELRDAAEDEEGAFEPEGDSVEVVYLVEGRQLGYGTKAAWGVRD